ncbi:MAG: 2TM domain-containing protein [Candidatus Helarchaeota archaeon]
MTEPIAFSEETLREIAAQKVIFRYSVKIHAISYIVGNVMLFIINSLVSIHNWWAFYPLFGWLIGLMIHIVAYLVWSRGINYGKRAIIFHLVAYTFTMLLLVVVNLLDAGLLSWVFYPAIAWGFGFIAHLLIYEIITHGAPTKKEKRKSRKERVIEKEMQKLRKKMER